MSGTIVYIGTKNDTNGNPRRGWIIGYGTAEAYFVDEGYEGRSRLRRFGIDPDAGYLPRIDVVPSEYRYWTKRERVAP